MNATAGSIAMVVCLATGLTLASPVAAAPAPRPDAAGQGPLATHREVPDDPYVAAPRALQPRGPAARPEARGHVSVQVNVDADGLNIVGDAANEPSIAVDPTNPGRIVIGWRQFDTIASNFRQAGRGFSTDGGVTWTFPGVLEPGIFRSDPILDADAQGTIFYNSLGTAGGFCTDTFRSTDGGQSWDAGVFSFGGDKAWMAVDRSGGSGDGHNYAFWTAVFSCVGSADFTRSSDGGGSYETPVTIATQPQWGVTAVGPRGEVYVAGRRASSASQFVLAKSTTLRDPGQPMAFDFVASVDLGGSMSFGGPNPEGLLGQVWVAADPNATGPGAETVYMLSSVVPPGADPLDVHFVRSTDGGATWSAPVRINDDPAGSNAWQWFGTMSVAPDGRIDAVWNDTRNDPGGFDSQLFYSFSEDGGLTWSPNEPLTPAWDPHVGWPQQNKIGDYYDMVSRADGVHIAYAATFNGEQDVYYLRLRGPVEIFADGFESGDTSAWSGSSP